MDRNDRSDIQKCQNIINQLEQRCFLLENFTQDLEKRLEVELRRTIYCSFSIASVLVAGCDQHPGSTHEQILFSIIPRVRAVFYELFELVCSDLVRRHSTAQHSKVSVGHGSV